MDAKSQAGFTLWELLVSLLVAGIVLGFGVPNFMEFQRNNAMIAAANELVTGLYLARAEAVKRQAQVTLCGSADPMADPPVCDAGGNGGFVVFVDENGNGVVTDPTDGNAVIDAGETILLRRPAPGGAVVVSGDGGQYVTYGINGFAVERAQGHGEEATTVVLFCDDRGNAEVGGGRSSARVVRIAPTGRAQAFQDIAAVTAAAADTGGACP